MIPFFLGAPWYKAIFKNLCVSDSPINRATLFVTALTTTDDDVSIFNYTMDTTILLLSIVTFDAQHGRIYNEVATLIKN